MLGIRVGVGVGVGDALTEGTGCALHSVPGKYSSFSEELTDDGGEGEELAEALAEGLAEGDVPVLELSPHGGPETRPLGCWKAATGMFPWASPLLMKSRSTLLPTIVPKTPFMLGLPGPV